MQLADAPLIDMDLLYWIRHFRNMPGEGDLPVNDFMRAVAATGYGGPLSLEISMTSFAEARRDRFPSTAGARLAISSTGFNTKSRLSRCNFPKFAPPHSAVSGVEFMEFAADEHEAEQLAALLSHAWASREAGQHKTKDVTLCRQGGVNMVVNTEREGFAHSSYPVHGATAYAFGLEVNDAAATVERARILGAETFEQLEGPANWPSRGFGALAVE